MGYMPENFNQYGDMEGDDLQVDPFDGGPKQLGVDIGLVKTPLDSPPLIEGLRKEKPR